MWEQFHWLKKKEGTRVARCKDCHNAAMLEWSARNPEKRRAIARQWTERNREKSRAASARYYRENKEKANATIKRWQLANKDRRAAHSALAYQVRLGKIVRPETCESCGKVSKVVAHHHDYTKPLDVQWLCASCHGVHHHEEERRSMATKKKAARKADPKAKVKTQRICLKCKKAPVQFARSKRCLPCQLMVRKAQLKRNNKAWMKRIEAGKAGHRLVYAGKPTEFAVKKYGDKLPKKVQAVMAAKKSVSKASVPAKKTVAKPAKGNPFAKPAGKGKVAPPFKKKAKASAKAAVKEAVKASKLPRAASVGALEIPTVSLDIVPLAS